MYFAKTKRFWGIGLPMMMIVAIILLSPMSVQATAMLDLDIGMPGGTVELNVSAEPVSYNGGSDWKYTYNVYSSDLKLYYINVGIVLPGTTQKYVVWAWTLPQDADSTIVAQPPSGLRTGASSYKLYFTPDGLATGSNVNFSIIYDEPIETQLMTITAVGSGATANFQATYSGGSPPSIPEPTTVLLVGCGLLAFGFVHRRKR